MKWQQYLCSIESVALLQVINVLNTDELMVLLVNELVVPRTFHVEPTQVVFVSGLGRIDYVQVFVLVGGFDFGSENCICQLQRYC